MVLQLYLVLAENFKTIMVSCATMCNRKTRRLTLSASLAGLCAVHVTQHSPNNVARPQGQGYMPQAPMSHACCQTLPT